MLKKHVRGAKRKNISVRVDEDMFYLVSELSVLSNTSRGQLVADFLEVAKPQMETMIKALRMANDKNPEAFILMSEAVTKAAHDSMVTQTDMLKDLVGTKK